MRQVSENSYQTKIELVRIVIDKSDLLDYESIDDVIDENDDRNFNCFYHMTNFTYYSHQVDHFKFDKSIANFDFVKHAIQK